MRARLVLMVAPAVVTAGRAWPIAVDSSGLDPARLAIASRTTTVTITFDAPVDRASMTPSRLRVFGKQSGTAAGPITFSNADEAVTLAPSHPFLAGEGVMANYHF